MSSGGPAAPTLRCPRCGSSDLHFKTEGEVRCSRCFRKWTREELARTAGMVGSSYDREVTKR